MGSTNYPKIDLRPYDRTTVRPYDRTTVRPYKVLLLILVVNCTAGTSTSRLCSVVQWSVRWASSRTIRVLVLAGARRSALETSERKKMRAPLLGLAKSICYCKEKFCLGHSWELKG